MVVQISLWMSIVYKIKDGTTPIPYAIVRFQLFCTSLLLFLWNLCIPPGTTSEGALILLIDTENRADSSFHME